MLQFSQVTTEDKERLLPLLFSEKHRGCEYTFGNIYIWKDIYGTKVAYTDCGGAVIRHDRHGVGYLFPVGQCDLKYAIESMLADAEEEGDRFRIFAADKEDFSHLESIFPGKFQYKEERDYAEYIYRSENLRELAGKKYHKKRNHIARFLQEQPDYQFTVIDRGNIDRVSAMNERWYKEYGDAGESLLEEHCATKEAFDHFFELGMDGGFIENKGEIIAYSMGEAINSDTYCVHIEKAFHEIQGSYAIVNRDFARRFCSEYDCINREDDVGEEGLRKAKLSYYPEIITDKITITLR